MRPTNWLDREAVPCPCVHARHIVANEAPGTRQAVAQPRPLRQFPALLATQRIGLRAGNAGSNTAAGHIEATRLALAHLPKQRRSQVLIRTDSGGGTHNFLTWPTRAGRRLSYSIGFTLTEQVQQAVVRLPKSAWTPAYDTDRQVRPGAGVAELTGLLDLTGRPKDTRVIAHKERLHPGA